MEPESLLVETQLELPGLKLLEPGQQPTLPASLANCHRQHLTE
jgi:hypothetical protein